MSDSIHNPAHYSTGSIQPDTFIDDQALNFRRGNVVKYVSRAQHKGTELEDLKKAQWYLNMEVEKLEEAAKEKHTYTATMHLKGVKFEQVQEALGGPNHANVPSLDVDVKYEIPKVEVPDPKTEGYLGARPRCVQEDGGEHPRQCILAAWHEEGCCFDVRDLPVKSVSYSADAQPRSPSYHRKPITEAELAQLEEDVNRELAEARAEDAKAKGGESSVHAGKADGDDGIVMPADANAATEEKDSTCGWVSPSSVTMLPEDEASRCGSWIGRESHKVHHESPRVFPDIHDRCVRERDHEDDHLFNPPKPDPLLPTEDNSGLRSVVKEANGGD